MKTGQPETGTKPVRHMESLVTDTSGASVCACCGMVVEEKPMYRGPASYVQEHKITKETRSDRGLGALTDKLVVDNKVIEGKNKNEAAWFMAARNVCDVHSVPSPVHEEVCHMMRRALALNALDCRNRVETIVALIHLSFEVRGRRMPIGKFMKRFGHIISKRRLYRNTMELRGLFGMDPLQGRDIALDYLRRYGHDICHNRGMVRDAESLIEKAYASGNVAGHSPTCVMAAALHIAAADRSVHIPFLDLAKHVGITRVSVRNSVCAVFKREPYYGAEKTA